jgi:predicted SnoaL-like aldol condensation-catalyzing enzyme
MKLKLTIVFGFISLSFILFSHTLQAGQQTEETATASAQKWLTLIDEGKYSESWDEAAGFFRKAVQKNQWLASMEAFRKPLGALISRKLKSKKYTTSLPGAPDGKYVVIQYETSFEHKKSAIETVTPMLDKDGKWRVSGYYIK